MQVFHYTKKFKGALTLSVEDWYNSRQLNHQYVLIALLSFNLTSHHGAGANLYQVEKVNL